MPVPKCHSRSSSRSLGARSHRFSNREQPRGVPAAHGLSSFPCPFRGDSPPVGAASGCPWRPRRKRLSTLWWLPIPRWRSSNIKSGNARNPFEERTRYTRGCGDGLGGFRRCHLQAVERQAGRGGSVRVEEQHSQRQSARRRDGESKAAWMFLFCIFGKEEAVAHII